ncbi:2-hydroxyisoflavanone dehydratase-like [Hibiscus syriacus]|uniref:2-hydroxyisoflavanone dehydratase-like n=1 Tax=Hibiscus syriacus TaxID=106335 RepID=A0A6A2XEG3_HIBSY|nr:probable aspartic proteinase GIP2 [Hibiscus syriacus]KAE8674083.1 2-hydroxyisoflavanone dehydratase-like [Hibiscus syriacus]
MAISTSFLLFSASLLFFIVSPSIQASFRPKALVLPVSKDDSTNQYITEIKQRTPLVPVKLTLDLGAASLWVDCDRDYVSSTYKPARCNSAQCNLARSKSCGDCFEGPRPGCNNNTCNLFPANNVVNSATIGEVAQDVVSVQSTDGKSSGEAVSTSKFLFTCGSTFLMDGLASGVNGVAGLGRTKVSMPSQFSAAFSFPRKFAVCLGSSSGVVFFGDGPYSFLPSVTDISKSLSYTPLILNPVSTAPSSFEGEPSSDYFIGVTGISVNGKLVALNKTLLSINKEGHGGTKISTVAAYTLLQTSIYKAVVKAFIKEIPGVPRVKAVAPFGVCFDAKSISSTRVGPGVPNIDLELPNKVVWGIIGFNSMVNVGNDVLCLGFVDGGSEPTSSIVIGGHQIEHNLLQFDLAASRLGFSSSLLFQKTTCSNFNFTSAAYVEHSSI